MSTLNVLLSFYSITLFINAIISLAYFKKYKEQLYKYNFQLWSTYLLNFFAQGLLPKSYLGLSTAFLSYLPAAIIIAKILSYESLEFKPKKYYIFGAICFSSSLVLYFTTKNFILYSLPLCLSVSGIQLHSLFSNLKHKSKHRFTRNIFASVMFLNALHQLDYPFLAQTPYATWGFCAAIILAVAFSIVIPLHIISIKTEEYLDDMNDELRVQDESNSQLAEFVSIFDQQIISSVKRNNETLKKKTILLSTLAHDLSNSLQISLFSLKRIPSKIQKNDTEKLLHLCNKATSSVQKSIETVQLVKELEAMSLSPLAQSSSFLDLPQLIQELKIFFDELASRKNIKLIFENNELDVIHIYGDERLIQNNILHNLITNAIKFSYQGSTVHIYFSYNQDLDTYDFTVKDSGVGMTDHELERVLSIKTRQTTIGTDGEKGTGLGLSLVRSYVEMLGGYFSIDTQVKVGTQVTFSLKNASSALSGRQQVA